ncbi:MAG: hypothetical protein KBE21_04815 [Acetoanaerobium sp.]|jgi:hypothetical protein|nr:hypothetical protein [Acetoanaerobium sp.]
MLMRRKYMSQRKSRNKKANTFIALWSDDNGNRAFGILNSLCKTKEAAIQEILKDISFNNYENLNLDQCRLDLIQHWELNIPSVINYKIETIY